MTLGIKYVNHHPSAILLEFVISFPKSCDQWRKDRFHTSIIVLLMPFVRSLKMTKMHEKTTVVKYEIEE